MCVSLSSIALPRPLCTASLNGSAASRPCCRASAEAPEQVEALEARAKAEPIQGVMAEQAALELLRQLAQDFSVRDPRKLYQIAKREFPERPGIM